MILRKELLLKKVLKKFEQIKGLITDYEEYTKSVMPDYIIVINLYLE